MPTVLACLRRSVERMWPRRVPTRFGPATRLRRPKNQWNQGPLATSQARMCPRTANSGLAVDEAGPGLGAPAGGGARRGRQRAGGAVPHALAAEAVPPPADRLPRREVLGQRPPAAALGDEVEASLHDRPNGGAQRTVRREEGHGQCPLPVRQIARIALPGLTVDFTVGLRPHAHACEVILSSRENMGMLRSNRVSGQPRWTYLGDIGQETTAKYDANWVFQVAPDQSTAYLIARHGLMFRMNLKTVKATGPVDLTKLDPSFAGLQFYGFDAWDNFGRFYFAAFGGQQGLAEAANARAPQNSRLVAIDPDQLPSH